ncbi:hypothetical protein BDW67DRAFT_172998 [Aspergillus spinulosporus]
MSQPTDSGATGESPSLFWRSLSSTTILGVAALCRGFLYACSRPETHGLEQFLELLDSRKDPSQRKKGLLTVSNHISVMDDPLVWGFLPLKYNFGLSSSNRRWGMASHDICYQSRSAHSKHGGIAQPAVTQAIRLLSKGPFPAEPHLAKPERQSWSLQNVCVDPFSDLPTAYTTDGEDSHLAPSAYSCNSYSWVHIFPEGKIHQSPNKTMRYFKWGVARLILEASECPDIVPMWLEGFDQVMHESREFPRFLPRPGKEVSVTFGQKVDTEAVFGEMRRRWQKIKAKAELASPEMRNLPLGALSDELLYGDEAVELRKEVTKKVRDLVLEVRRSRGHSDEDPKAGLVETWMEEGGKREGKMKDESWVRDLNTYAKPTATPHYTLSSSPNNSQNDRFRTPERPSVNDLIDHLRRTQLSPSALDNNNRSIPRYVTPRSVHPSLRNVLELPETPPPRPRPDARRTGLGQRRLWRTPGPPPPESWLPGDTSANEDEDADLNTTETARVLHRLERLPGSEFPAKSSFLHMLLRSMAMRWTWHVDYDGQFLGFLPTHIKALGMRGLKPLLDNMADVDVVGYGRLADGDSNVARLDLSGALGRWISLKQLSAELIPSKRKAGSAEDDEYENDADSGTTGAVSKPLQHLRFENLQYLSLAHPQKAAVNWNSLIHLLSRLSTITHLSLAHWPVPTVTPNAVNARVRHPAHRSLTFSYGGTDSYSAMENNWAESAGILRRLSRATYCLKWLDLEGCADWIPALNWEGVGPDGETYSTGPEWNGSWRDVEWIRLGPGWLPQLEDSELATLSGAVSTSNISTPSPQSLASSMHVPAASDVSTETWDVEHERQKYRRAKELERFRGTMHAAKEVQQRVLRARKDGRGKWVHFSFGLEELTSEVRDKLLGEELRDKFL